MKKIKFIALLGALSTLFMGCPYSTEIAIDQPSVKVDEKLLGKWESKSSSEETYNVTKIDDNTFKVEKRTKSSETPTIYNGFISEVGGTRYLNMWEVTEGSTTITYYLYKLQISNSGAKATLSPVTENIDEKFATSKELKDFILKNQGLSFFYEKDEEEYIKAD